MIHNIHENQRNTMPKNACFPVTRLYLDNVREPADFDVISKLSTKDLSSCNVKKKENINKH